MGTSRSGRELPQGRMDVVHSLEVETSHVKWADPYSRGPLRAWLMPDVVGGRDVAELAQRLGLVYDTLTFDRGGYNTWGFGDFYGRRGGPDPNYEIDHGYLIEDLTAETHYDVLVLPGTHPWNELPEAARAAVARRVKEGAGLVLVTPRCHPEQLGELAELSPLLPMTKDEVAVGEDSWKEARPVTGERWKATRPHFLTAGVPLAALPTERMGVLPYRATGEALVEANGAPVVAVKSYGAGRVVAFGYDNFCFSPRVSDPWRCELTHPYWEYYYSLLCRALVWAANREPEVRLAQVEVTGGAVRLGLEGASRPVTVALTFRDERYHEERVVTVEANSPGEVEVAVPEGLNGGGHFADVIVREAVGTLDWGTAQFVTPRGVSICELALTREVVQVGEQVTGEVKLAAEGPRQVAVELRFEDNYGRTLDQAAHTLTVEGEANLPFSLTSAHALTRLGRVMAEVREGERLLDQRKAELFVRTPQVWEDYETIMDRFLPEPAPGRWPQIARQLAKMHVSTMGAISPAMSEQVNFLLQADVVAYGFHPRHAREEWERSRKGYLATRDKRWLERKPCFYDPAYREKFREDLTRKVTSFVHFSPISYYAYEEPSLTHYRGGLDFCWCEHCRRGFRAWLQGAYGTLEALNREWGTSYTSWEEAGPLTTEEAQASGCYPRWADYRTWMEVMWADTYRLGREIIKGLDPNAVICLSGNQVGTPYNGYDYSRLNHYVDQMQLYGSENLDEFNRSFYKGMLCTGCTGYGISDPYLGLQLWGWLLNGNTAGVVIFWEISCLNPDLTLCRSGRDLARHFGELRGDGIARLLSTAQRDHCGIAIHYSYPSFHGTWITDGEIVDHEWANLSSQAWRQMNRDRMAWTQVLEGLGYQYDFIAYGQIEEGYLEEGGYRLLILPESVALSEREAAAIEEFVAKGGVVISDLWPGVMNEHCSWRQGGRLDALFGISHGALEPADFRRLEVGDRVRVTKAEQGWCAGHEAVTRRRHGQGKAIHLGFSLASLYGERNLTNRAQLVRFTDLVSKLLAEAELAPPAQVRNAQGDPATTCESARYRAGTADYFGVVRYPAGPDEQEEIQEEAAYTVPLEEARGALSPDEVVHITFPEARHVYEVRSRQYLGWTDRVQTEMSYGDARIYARLPYTVKGVAVSGPERVAAGESVPLRVGLTTSGESDTGDHVATLQVYGPEGSRYQHYERRVALPRGCGEVALPLAKSDPAGQWRVVARDVATGVEGELRFVVA